VLAALFLISRNRMRFRWNWHLAGWLVAATSQGQSLGRSR